MMKPNVNCLASENRVLWSLLHLCLIDRAKCEACEVIMDDCGAGSAPGVIVSASPEPGNSHLFYGKTEDDK